MRHGCSLPSIIGLLLPAELLANFLLERINGCVSEHLDGEAISEAIIVHLLVSVVDRDVAKPFAIVKRCMGN